VFECLGVQDVVAKSVGSSNPHNMIKAAFAGLTKTESPKTVASRRGLKVSDIVGRRGAKGATGGDQERNGEEAAAGSAG
jgi:small subunit ribosomal protein S5